MIVENLLQFGLNEKEISVYLSLISLGPSPVRVIAKQAGVNRGTSYDILKSLVKLGLVAYYKQNKPGDKKQHFVAEPPEKLLEAVENKRKNMEILKVHITKSLPELESMYEKSGAKPVSKYYEGMSGIRVILQDVLGSVSALKDKIYYVYSSADIREYLYKAYPNFNKDRIKAGIANQVIAFGKGGDLAGLDERKWMDREHASPTYILIYSGKVAMISVDAAGEPVGVVVEDQALYETQKMIFEFNWSRL
jgi:sugar-specific transcriptional regulator TrmB